MAEGPTSLSACAAQVRRHEPDRYVATLFAPPDRREALFALYAFGAELARVPERVSEAMLGAIRLQWWRETLDGIAAGTPRRHEVVGPLAAAATRHGLTLEPLYRVIESWETELEREGVPSLADLEALADGAAALDEAALGLLGASGDVATHAARHGARAAALGTMLRQAMVRAAEGRPVLPRDVLARHGLDLGTMLDAGRDERLAAAAGELADRARDHVAEARRIAPSLPRQARCILLPVSFVAGDLAVLRRHGHDLFHPAVARRGFTRLAPVVLRGLTGRV